MKQEEKEEARGATLLSATPPPPSSTASSSSSSLATSGISDIMRRSGRGSCCGVDGWSWSSSTRERTTRSCFGCCWLLLLLFLNFGLLFLLLLVLLLLLLLISRLLSGTHHIAYFLVHSRANSLYFSRSVLYILAISGTSGSSGLGSHSREQIDNNTFDIVNAGDH